MNLKLVYDQEVDVLRLLTAEKGSTSSSLLGLEEVVIDLATNEGHHVVAVEVTGASAYLPLGERGYDAQTDTLTLGTTVNDPRRITENGDIVTFWQTDEEEPGSFMDPIGVAVRNASIHLSAMSGQMGAMQ